MKNGALDTLVNLPPRITHLQKVVKELIEKEIKESIKITVECNGTAVMVALAWGDPASDQEDFFTCDKDLLY